MSDPVEIAAGALLGPPEGRRDPTALGGIWDIDTAWRKAEAMLTALHAAGWRIVQAEPIAGVIRIDPEGNEKQIYRHTDEWSPEVAGAGGGLNGPSNFTDSPTPTPTPEALAALAAVARRLRDGWHVMSTTVVDGVKHEWWRAVWDGPDEIEAMTPAEWDAFQSLDAGPSPAGTPETDG